MWVPRRAASAAEVTEPTTEPAPANVADQRATRVMLAEILAHLRDQSARLESIENTLTGLLPLVQRGQESADLDRHLAAIEGNQAAYEQHRAARRRAEAIEHAEQLRARVPLTDGRRVITYKAAQVALRCSPYQAREALANLEAYELAEPAERRGNQPKQWFLTDTEDAE